MSELILEIVFWRGCRGISTRIRLSHVKISGSLRHSSVDNLQACCAVLSVGGSTWKEQLLSKRNASRGVISSYKRIGLPWADKVTSATSEVENSSIRCCFGCIGCKQGKGTGGRSMEGQLTGGLKLSLSLGSELSQSLHRGSFE